MLRQTVVICWITLFFITTIPVAAQNCFSIQAIGTSPGHSGSFANDINNNGTVLCTALSVNDISGFTWSDNIITYSGLGITTTAGINNNDQTTGIRYYYGSSGGIAEKFTPYIRNADGSIQNLAEITGVREVWLKGVDNSGGVIVNYQHLDSYRVSCAFVNTSGLVNIEIPYGDAALSAISNNGKVILNNKYLWTLSGGPSLLPWLMEADDVNITCVNDLGWVAGTLSGHAVRWDAEGNFTDFGVGNATAINNRGQVVGNVDSKAVLWDIDGSISYLPLLDGYSYTTAVAINDNGQIVGSGWQDDLDRMAVLWQPIPEPSSLLALFAGFAGIGGVALRRRR